MLRTSEIYEESEYEDVAKSTKAVIFFGTPHRGSSELADLGQVVRSVASKILRVDTNSALLRALGVDQPELEQRRLSFTKQWRNLGFRVKTFQEGHGISGINIGVLNEKVS